MPMWPSFPAYSRRAVGHRPQKTARTGLGLCGSQHHLNHGASRPSVAIRALGLYFLQQPSCTHRTDSTKPESVRALPVKVGKQHWVCEPVTYAGRGRGTPWRDYLRQDESLVAFLGEPGLHAGSHSGSRSGDLHSAELIRVRDPR